MTYLVWIIIIVGEMWILFTNATELYFMKKYNYGSLIYPTDLHRLTKMNWFGCWVCFIFISILNPTLAIFKLIDWLWIYYV